MVVRGRWAPPPMEGKGSREGQGRKREFFRSLPRIALDILYSAHHEAQACDIFGGCKKSWWGGLHAMVHVPHMFADDS